jgi:hypothetical protein
MRLLLLMLGICLGIIGFGNRAEAQNYPWCAIYSEGAAGGVEGRQEHLLRREELRADQRYGSPLYRRHIAACPRALRFRRADDELLSPIGSWL